MSGAYYPMMLSMVLPIIDGLHNMLCNAQAGLDVLRDILITLTDEKFGDLFSDEELCISTIVDPKFKVAVFDNDNVRQRAIDATRRALVKLRKSSFRQHIGIGTTTC